MSQLELLDRVAARARWDDPETSKSAAAEASKTLTVAQQMVKAVLINGPMIDEEIVARIRDHYPDRKISDQSIRSRRAELVRRNYVEFAGEYGTTCNGQRSRKWRLVNA